MSLVKKLKREMKASPGKAGGLVALMLLASYFWLPLVQGLFVSEDEPAPPATAAPPIPSTSPATTTRTPPTGTEAAKPASEGIAYDWQEKARKMSEDPAMRVAVELPSRRDPFHTLKAPPRVASEKNAEVMAEEQMRSIGPAQAGLVLSSTVIGPRKRIAEISGKSYEIGDSIPVANLGTKFELVDVQPRRAILLAADGKRHVLKIPRPLLDEARQAQAQTGEDDATSPANAKASTVKTGAIENDEDETAERSDELTE